MAFYNYFRIYSPNSSGLRRVLLAVTFSGGLLTGFFLYLHIPYNSCLMCMLPWECVSIVGLLVVLFLPLFFSALAAFFSKKGILLLVVFLKGLTFCYCAAHTIASFGDAGWLLRWLLMFSDSLMLPPLVWFWNRNILGSGSSFLHDCTMCGILGVVIGVVDYFFISPFLVSLIIT